MTKEVLLYSLLAVAALFCAAGCTGSGSSGRDVTKTITEQPPYNKNAPSNRSPNEAVITHFVAEPTQPPSLSDEGTLIDQQHAWVGGFSLKRTTDGGREWKQMRPSSEDVVVFGKEGQAYLKPYFITPTRGWLEAGSGTWQTEDGGMTWRLLFPGGSDLPVFADDRHGWINVALGDLKEQSYTTQDGGKTWQTCGAQRGYNRQTLDGKAYFLTLRLGWGITGRTVERQTIYGVARTTDGGCNWHQLWVSNDNPDEWYDDIYFIDEREGWLAGKANGGLYHTTNGGKTWNDLPLPYEGSKVTHVYFGNHNEGWIIVNKLDGSPATFFHTTDAGQKWLPLTANDISADDVIPSKWNAGQMLRMLYIDIAKNRDR